AAGAPAPANPNAADHPIYVEGFQGTPAEIERQWYEKVYLGRGDRMPQLTLRAILMGTVLGGILSLTNLYVGLKAGWTFGVAITACIVSYTTWNLLRRIGLARTPMTILENNCMQSTASAAGASTGGTLISAFAAYIMINNQSLPLWQMLAWVFILAVMGVTMAIPMKRQMINTEQLRFPSGIAAAVTLRTLYSEGSKSSRSARALTIGGILAALSQLWMDGLQLISAKLAPYSLGAFLNKLNVAVLGKVWMSRTVFFLWDPIFVAGGALMGLRAGMSMLLGGTLCWVVFVPIMQAHGVITGSGFRDIVQWTLWGGVSCMVTSGLLSFFAQWRSIVAAISSVRKMLARQGAAEVVDPLAAIETPMSWFFAVQGVGLIVICWLGKVSFNMPVWQSAVAVLITFFLALVACRVTGETDTTPIGPMGKVTQLLFGALSPGNMNINLMSANITACAANSSADLLTDLKSGYLLGANPRKQFLAQFAGIFMGTFAMVLAFRVLVPNASVLGSDQFPAPAAQTWRAVAIALSHGLEALEPIKVWSIAIGGTVGVLLVLLPKWLPKHREWIPSPAAFGMAWTFHWYYSMLFCLGSVIARLVENKNPALSEAYTWPVASGVVAGGSLMGVLIVFWENGPEMWRQFFGH
ncbi:MAG: OPT family oligopeptide transporter, partial [Opitutales bacterium]